MENGKLIRLSSHGKVSQTFDNRLNDYGIYFADEIANNISQYIDDIANG